MGPESVNNQSGTICTSILAKQRSYKLPRCHTGGGSTVSPSTPLWHPPYVTLYGGHRRAFKHLWVFRWKQKWCFRSFRDIRRSLESSRRMCVVFSYPQKSSRLDPSGGSSHILLGEGILQFWPLIFQYTCVSKNSGCSFGSNPLLENENACSCSKIMHWNIRLVCVCVMISRGVHHNPGHVYSKVSPAAFNRLTFRKACIELQPLS